MITNEILMKNKTGLNEKHIEQLSKELIEFGNGKYQDQRIIDKLLATIQTAKKDYNSSKELLHEGATFIVGTTGVGKSTLLNFLAGKKLKVIKDEDSGITKLELENPDDAISAIGTGDGKSKTLFPIIYFDKTNDITYVDCPGEDDSHGLAQQIINSYLKYTTFRDASKVRVLYLTSYNSINESNGANFVGPFKQLIESLIDFKAQDKEDLSQEVSNNFSLVVTRTPYKKDSKEKVINQLKKLAENQKYNLGSSLKILESIINKARLEFFLSPNEEDIGKLYNELYDVDGKRASEVISLIKDTKQIDNYQSLFKLNVSGEAIPPLTKVKDKLTESLSEKLPTTIIERIKKKFLEAFSNGQDLETFVELKEEEIIKKGRIKSEALQDFLVKIGLNVEQDSLYYQVKFFNKLLGEDVFDINLGSLGNDFHELKIETLLNTKQELTTESMEDQGLKGNRLVLRGFDIKNSEFIEEMPLYIKDNPILQVDIQALHKVLLDRNFDFHSSPKLEGVNLSIIAPVWQVPNSVKIDLSGVNGIDSPNTKAKDGKSKKKASLHKNGEDGENGADGLSGKNGHKGGSFLGIANFLLKEDAEKITLILNGGKGGNGQDAGNGGNGGEGGNAENPDSQGIEVIKYDKEELELWERVAQEDPKHTYLRRGGSGGNGGNSGAIGNGGFGGKPGLIDLFIPHHDLLKITTNTGQDGSIGKPGIPGKGSKAGLIYYCSFSPFGPLYITKLMKPGKDNHGKDGELKGLNPQTKPIIPEAVNEQAIIRYEKYLISHFANKDISKDVALMVLNDLIKDSDASQALIKSSPHAELKSKLSIKGLIEELLNLDELYSNYLFSNNVHYNLKALSSLYKTYLSKIQEYGKNNVYNLDELDQEVIYNIYTSTIATVSSLESIYTVVNFNYLEYLWKDRVLDYENIVKTKKIYSKEKEYNKKIEQEISNAKEVIKDLDKKSVEISNAFQVYIDELKTKMRKDEHKMEKYAYDLKNAAVLKVTANTFKLVGSMVSYFGPIGQALGGTMSLTGSAMDFFAPNFKPLTLKDLSPTTYLGLAEKRDKIDGSKLIGLLGSLRDNYNYPEIPNDETLNKNFEGKPVEFLKSYKEILDNRAQALQQDLSVEQYRKELAEQKKIKGEYQKYQDIRNATHIASAMQVANNIISTVQDCRSVMNEVDKAFAASEGFKKFRKEIEFFIEDSLHKFIEDVSTISDSMAEANSHAKIDFLRFKFKDSIDEVLKKFQNKLQAYEYPGKEDFLSLFNKFDMISEYMAKIYDRIENEKDRQDLADLIVSTVDPNHALIKTRYKNFLKLTESKESNIIIKEGNDILSMVKQSSFPLSPFYSYNTYKTNLELKDNKVQTVIEGIKLAYKQHTLNKLAISGMDKYIFTTKFNGIIGCKNPFSIYKEPLKFAELLKGEGIEFTSDIRNAPQYSDAIKFKEIGIQFKIYDSKGKVEEIQTEIFNKLAENFRFELTSSGDYYYRFINKYYKIPSSKISLSASYKSNYVLNEEYRKIKEGDAIFSPYTTWNLKLVPIRPEEIKKDILYEKFYNDINNLELHLIGEAMYIDTHSFDKGKAELSVDQCYEIFEDDFSSEVPLFGRYCYENFQSM
jgi:hypothetical protein